MKYRKLYLIITGFFLLFSAVKCYRRMPPENASRHLLPREIPLENIASVSIQSQRQTITLVHQENQWTIEETQAVAKEEDIVMFIADLYNATARPLSNVPPKSVALTPETGAIAITLYDARKMPLAHLTLGDILLSNELTPSPLGR